MNEDYMDFEKVLKELEIEEEELKRLVSAGEIKAFRDADQMKFKREEIEKIKENRGDKGPDVIELLDSDEEISVGADADLTEELTFDDEELGSDVGMATEQISDEFLDEELAEEGSGEEIELGAFEEDEEEVLTDAGPAAGRRRTRSGKLVTKSKIAGMAEEVEEVEPQWALGILIVSTLALIIGTIVMIDIATSTPSPLVEWLVNIFRS